MAEAVFAHKVKEAGLADKILVDSAGTGGWHEGEPPHLGTRRVLESKMIEYSHRARILEPADFDNFDYILTMDEDNFRTVNRMKHGTAKVVRFMDFAPELEVREVPDPWYDGRFEHVYSLIDRAAQGLLEMIQSEKNL
jgi:protein-tyrosine phosphatase